MTSLCVLGAEGVSVCPRVYVAKGASKCARVAVYLSVFRDCGAESVCGSLEVSLWGCSLWVWGSDGDLCGHRLVCVRETGSVSLSGSQSVYSLYWCVCACTAGRGLCVPGVSGYVCVCHSALEELFPGSHGPTLASRPAPLMQALAEGIDMSLKIQGLLVNRNF